MSSRISIRKAEPGDAADLQALADISYAQYKGVIDPMPKPVSYDYADVIAQGQTWVVVCPAGDVIGMITLAAQCDHMLARNMCLHPLWQGRGLAVRLAKFAEAQALDREFSLLKFWTNVSMPKNIKFYKRLGYRETHRSSNAEHSFVHFERDLSVEQLGRHGYVEQNV